MMSENLKYLNSKYGNVIYDIIINWSSYPEILMIDLAELMGISRERVRQLILLKHADTKKPLLSRCSKTNDSFVKDVLLKKGMMFTKIKTATLPHPDGHRCVDMYKFLDSNKVFAIRKFGAFKPKINTHLILRCTLKNYRDVDYLISYYGSNIYIIPAPVVSKNGIFNMSLHIINEKYKNRFDLLK